MSKKIVPPQLVLSQDGTHTLYSPAVGEHYHSARGAMGESAYVYIGSGLQWAEAPRDVLEVGLGSGLNAYLTQLWARRHNVKIEYTALEPYPVPTATLRELNYWQFLQCEGGDQASWEKLCDAPFGERVQLDATFSLLKKEEPVEQLNVKEIYDVVYFDAFSPASQPELWDLATFSRVFAAMRPGGVIVTYSATRAAGDLWKECGIQVERLPGVLGKRQIMRGVK